MKKTILLVFTVIAVMISSNGCKKGDTGPQGPAGTNGNANVIGINTVTILSEDWEDWWGDWGAYLPVAEITQDIVDKGIVQVFIRYGDDSWWPLPDINGINSTLYGFSLGEVELLNWNSDGTQADNPGDQTFRIVIISASKKMANPNLNWKNYNEIKQVFNLVD